MPMRYTKLFEKFKQQGISTYKIRKEKMIPESTLQKFRDGKSVTTDTLCSLCKLLHCQPGDIMEYTDDLEDKDINV